MRTLQAFIFTKDRAAQLRLLLESFHTNCSGLFRPYILWRASSDFYKEGYERLRAEPWLRDLNPLWIEESRPIKEEFVQAMEVAREDLGVQCIFTDDSVFYRKCGITAEQVHECFNENVLCFSFRLGLNTLVQDYQTGRRQPALKSAWFTEHETESFVEWNWRDQYWTDNYGYPFGMDGCAYKAEDLIEVTAPLQFGTFRSWEGVLSGHNHRSTCKKCWMVAPKESCVVNIPVNSMQDPPIPHSPKIHVSAEELNQRYLEGEVIDLAAMDFSAVVGAHQEIPYRFRSLN